MTQPPSENPVPPPQSGWGQAGGQPPAWGPAPQQPASWGSPMPPGAYHAPAKPSRAKALLIALLTLVALAGGGITVAVVLSSGKSGSPSAAGGGPGEAKQLWAAPAAGPNNGDNYGGWLVDDHTVAYVAESGITGYELETGKQLWQVRPPAGQQICAMSPMVDGGIGAVGLGTDAKHCATAAAIDVKAGKQLWSAEFTLPDNFQGYTKIVGDLSVAASTVVVQTPETIFGYGATDGQRHWAAPHVEEEGEFGGDCSSIAALATGEQTAQALDCGRDGVKVVAYDTASGAVKWITKASDDSAPGSWWFLSANPVVAVDARTGIYYLAGQGARPMAIGKTATGIGFPSSQHSYGTAAFDGNTMVTVETGRKEHESMHDQMTLVAYDLNSGKRLWTHEFEEDSEAVVIGIDNGMVHVDYNPADFDLPEQLLSFSLADGAMTEGPLFGDDDNVGVRALAVHVVGDKIVQFGAPAAPVTVWR